MSGRSEEAQQDHQRPKPVRFSIFGQIQQQAAAAASLAVHQRGALHHLSADDYHEDRYEDDDEEEEELVGADQPLDFSAKKSEPQITAKVMAVGGHHHYQAWGHHLPSHSSESGVSDLCSNSPQSDGEPSAPNTSGSPTTVQPQQTVKAPAPMSPLPATLNAIYGPLAALQQNGRQQGNNQAMDPTLSAATSQLLSNLAAVTNGGKGGKNTRPFKAYPRDPMSLPLGLYGLPMAGNAGEETVMTQASNDAYAEFRRQMLSQVNATKSKRKTSISNGGNSSINGNSRPNSVTGDEDMDMTGPNDNDMPEATHIRGTVSVTDMRLVSGNEDDSEHSGNDSIHHAPMKSPPNGSLHIAHHHQHYADLSGLGSSSSMMLAATTSNGSAGSAGSSSKKRGRNGEEIKDDAYWERRRKNNEAAKRSRDARRAKEDEIAIRAAFLEQENLKLRFELANLKNETAKLRCMIYNS